MYWASLVGAPKDYICGHTNCGLEVGANEAFHCKDIDAYIYICPKCKRPTFFDSPTIEGIAQVPGVPFGEKIGSLPTEISRLYNEIRLATSQGAYTAAVLACRKMLMHIAVQQGDKPGHSFVEYVDYLVDNHHAPRNSKLWVDKIRSKSNEANHDIVIMSKDDAIEIITFVAMLLKFIYEFPARANPKPTP